MPVSAATFGSVLMRKCVAQRAERMLDCFSTRASQPTTNRQLIVGFAYWSSARPLDRMTNPLGSGTEKVPPITLLSRFNDVPVPGDEDILAQIAHKRGPRTNAANELPELDAFANVNDPSTVTEVSPNNLRATLGPDAN